MAPPFFLLGFKDRLGSTSLLSGKQLRPNSVLNHPETMVMGATRANGGKWQKEDITFPLLPSNRPTR